LLILLGVRKEDTETEAEALLDKVLGLRVFNDCEGKMNLSVAETGGAVLVVSQFTLYGDTRKGRRPSFDQAALPEQANQLYKHFVAKARERGIETQTGVFRAHMMVSLTNDGPVTLMVETKNG
jgi:D-tyrosyl-tRNA(Tyr) deacylase